MHPLVDQLMMEFSIPVAGDVAVLTELPDNVLVGLGCVDVRFDEIDTPEQIVARRRGGSFATVEFAEEDVDAALHHPAGQRQAGLRRRPARASGVVDPGGGDGHDYGCGRAGLHPAHLDYGRAEALPGPDHPHVLGRRGRPERRIAAGPRFTRQA